MTKRQYNFYLAALAAVGVPLWGYVLVRLVADFWRLMTAVWV